MKHFELKTASFLPTILITGAYGFVGSNLAAYLKDRYTLWALDVEDRVPGLYARYFSWRQAESLPWEQVDGVIHLAGKAHDTKNQSEAKTYFDINTGLTQRIYDRFLLSGAEKFIFFSSVKAAADSVPGEVLTEEVAPDPVGPYGESKIRAEEYLQGHSSAKHQLVYILRPCMIHGPGNKGNLNLLYNVVKKGIPWPLGAFENRRSFTSIDNLCYVIDLLLAGEAPSGIYQMADDEALSTNELIGAMCEVMERKAHIWKLPQGWMRGLASAGGALHLPLNPERLRKLTENYVVSNKKIKTALDIDKMPVTARDGLIKTIRSFSL
ncbi:NAD-dependent epimerase/dehydratase family protein [Parabacteroides sp. Marseille-P3160]|uniref:NAD-dependent epimerase/dehydratase family protein n=1 Tax=Parabacteroides sp. Marseille-P3160 TaxID=1917887 RepID=UPI0009BB01A5|nr:NAD-dependent epimerase/dehydratase family protein [Parabacteroides sp. Marseille-P3160]